MKRRVLLLLLSLGLLLLPVVYRAPFFLHIIILIFFYIALTEAWNIMALCGKVSLGHSAFFGLGAYTSAILCVKAGVIPWIGVFPCSLGDLSWRGGPRHSSSSLEGADVHAGHHCLLGSPSPDFDGLAGDDSGR